MWRRSGWSQLQNPGRVGLGFFIPRVMYARVSKTVSIVDAAAAVAAVLPADFLELSWRYRRAVSRA
eukprot:1025817-Pyramimonas_sp.AAC.1